MALIGEMQYLTIGGNTYSLPVGGGGTVTSVAVSNATNGGLSVSGSPISSSGTITIGHSNVLAAAQTTQAVYPIKIDKNGHISAYGNAVTIPTVNNATLTIQKNGTTVNSFTANASSNVTANIIVPTKTSDLTNDSGFITASHTSTYSLPLAADGTRGGVQIGYSESGKDYAVKLSSEKMYVTVPWTDTKVTTAALKSGTTYYPILATGTGTATRQIDSTLSGLKYVSTAGTTSAVGTAILCLGNTTGSGTANNEQGVLRLYSSNATYYTDLKSSSASSIKTITFPNKTGTVALTSDISSTSTPTADRIAEFDSTAHMNSTDMTSQEVDDFVDGLNISGGGNQVQTRKLLYTNTTAPFSAQIVSLDLSDYDYVEVWFMQGGTSDAILPNPQQIPIGEFRNVVVVHAINTSGTNENTGARLVTVTTTGVSFGDYSYKNRRSEGTQTVANQFAIPQYIYGIKYL